METVLHLVERVVHVMETVLHLVESVLHETETVLHLVESVLQVMKNFLLDTKKAYVFRFFLLQMWKTVK
jgi:hypothetical protein